MHSDFDAGWPWAAGLALSCWRGGVFTALRRRWGVTVWMFWQLFVSAAAGGCAGSRRCGAGRECRRRQCRWRAGRHGNVLVGCGSQGVGQDAGEDGGVVAGVVRARLRDAPVLGEGGELDVVGVEVESCGQFDGAEHFACGQGQVGASCFGGEECVIECGVVRDQDSAVQQCHQGWGYVAELWLSGECVSGQAVDVGRAGVDVGVEQADEGVADGAVGVEGEGGDAQDTAGLRVGAGGFHVDDDPVGWGGRGVGGVHVDEGASWHRQFRSPHTLGLLPNCDRLLVGMKFAAGRDFPGAAVLEFFMSVLVFTAPMRGSSGMRTGVSRVFSGTIRRASAPAAALCQHFLPTRPLTPMGPLASGFSGAVRSLDAGGVGLGLGGRRSRRSESGAFVGGAVLGCGDAQQAGQDFGVGVGQGQAGSFDAAECGGGDLGGGGQLGLFEAFGDAPVRGEALAGVDAHDLLDRGVEGLHDSCQQVDGGGAAAGFPCVHGGLSDAGHAGEVGDGEVAFAADSGELLGLETSQAASAHAVPGARFIGGKSHRGLRVVANTAAIDCCNNLEYGSGRNNGNGGALMTRNRAAAHRPVPDLPGDGPLAPNFAPIPASARCGSQVATPVRPLYWWIQAADAEGVVLHGLYFNNLTHSAVVRIRLASYRVVEVIRDARGLTVGAPNALAAVMVEAVWRLGAAGWADEIARLSTVLRRNGILGGTAMVPARTDLIPHLSLQPDAAVRVAYWWARELLIRGWLVHACGQDVAGGGFIATVPTTGGEPVLALYPSRMRPDGTEAALLAKFMPRLSPVQRRVLQRLVDQAAAAVLQGQVI